MASCKPLQNIQPTGKQKATTEHAYFKLHIIVLAEYRYLENESSTLAFQKKNLWNVVFLIVLWHSFTKESWIKRHHNRSMEVDWISGDCMKQTEMKKLYIDNANNVLNSTRPKRITNKMNKKSLFEETRIGCPAIFTSLEIQTCSIIVSREKDPLVFRWGYVDTGKGALLLNHSTTYLNTACLEFHFV